ncbi:MAG TPA: hypothetical protein V6D29_07315 [Leptolyngbyaceae cyanobacterium]
MSRNYYPWKVQVLIDWLKLELATHKDSTLASNLPVPLDMLDNWLVNPSPDITLQQLQAIAHYRGQTLEQTAEWLEIKSAHLEELTRQALSQL